MDASSQRLTNKERDKAATVIVRVGHSGDLWVFVFDTEGNRDRETLAARQRELVFKQNVKERDCEEEQTSDTTVRLLGVCVLQ